MNTHELWQAALGELELKLSKAHFTTWFRNTFIIEYDKHQVTVGVPNTFTKAWLEKKYHKDILNAIQNITEHPIKGLGYRVETRASTPVPVVLKEVEPEPAPAPTHPINASYESLGFTSREESPRSSTAINSSYTFDSFVVGKQNELAHAAAQAVAAHPGGTYNPVFVYGDVGLGKTHLLQAIGNSMLQRNPNARVLYASCEQFTNDFIHAVRTGRAKAFKDRYRTVDLLLIDDIQFITGKEGTQEEFFHTFNTLHQDNKQIVICSDRPPKAIAALEKRLLSRLEWGMLVDVGAPDLETRIAILQLKCQNKTISLGRDTLQYIASNIQSNVRELEGALNKIVAVHQFKNIQPSLETIIPIIDSFDVNTIKKTVSPKHIIQTVTEYFDISIEDVLGKSREKRLAFPRQIIMYLLREEMSISYPSIGTELGGRDHTTAMHAYSKIAKILKDDDQLNRDLDLIKQKMYAG
ncbi:chromosomal replication initiator protein DnaA [Candidatus Uhrbacteria bacterium]|jgi:chromosomal replication initiator protein|nr:chromosomal replication initiator protein DnaA [Candidatus Uhrbacteria bacterium]